MTPEQPATEPQPTAPDPEASASAAAAAAPNSTAGPAARRGLIWAVAAVMVGAVIVGQVLVAVGIRTNARDLEALRTQVAALSTVASTAPEPASVGAASCADGICDTADRAVTTTAPPASSTSVVVAPASAVDGVEVGFTDEGYPYRGNPDAAVTLFEYSDYACPFCGSHNAQTVPALLEDYAATGKALFVFRDFPLDGLHPTAPLAHAAARCVAEQDAAAFWQMNDAIFARQTEWTSLPDPRAFLATLAEGIPGLDLAAYQECVASGRADAAVQAGMAEGQALGFTGTPSFRFVDNESGAAYTLVGAQPAASFTSWLDAIIAGEAPPDAAPPADDPPPSGDLPLWASPAGLAPDPDRPGYNLAGDAFKGDPTAPVVVVEFSDFECPFCREHALDVQPVIDTELVDTGQVLWVFKHFPLAIHASASTAAAGAECAGDQGRFWSMHDLMFERVEEWASGQADTAIVALAAELGLDTDLFSECLGSRAALERVLADVNDAAGLINSTPTFALLYGGRGQLQAGFLPAAEFVALLQSLVE